MVGWLMILSGLLLLLGIYYVTVQDLLQWYVIEKKSARTIGVVVDRKPSNMFRVPALITYRFEVSGADGRSQSYRNSQRPKSTYGINSEVTIVYAASDPSYSRLAGEEPDLLGGLIVAVSFVLVAGFLFYGGIATIKVGMKHKQFLSETISCPYCGAKLRTRSARQCRECKREWHDQAATE